MALLIGPATAPALAADEDPNVARLMAPCYQALRAEERVRPKIYARSPGLAAAHQTILNAIETNSRCSATLSPMASMHLATDAFLWSLLAEDEQLLNNPNWHHSLDVADRLLSRCASSPELVKQGVGSRCQNQRSFNVAFAREPYANDPCFRARRAEATASDELSGADIDQTRSQAAFKAANDGLSAVEGCQSPPMRLVTKAYLLSLRAEAEHDLDIPGWDRSFHEANDLLTQCSAALMRLPNDVAKNCLTQRSANETLAKEYRETATPAPGTTAPVSYTPMPWTYPIKAGFNPSTLSSNDPFATTVGYDTYAAIGSVPDLTTMFDFGSAGPPANLDNKFFRSNMLLFVVSQRTDQLCASRAQDVHQFVPASAAGPTIVPVIVVDYALTCQPPTTMAQPVAVLALQVSRPTPTNTRGQVEFIENGVHRRTHYYVPAPPRT